MPGSPDVDRRASPSDSPRSRARPAPRSSSARSASSRPARAARAARYYDSAFVVDPARRVVDRYDKTHLVPFGEYVPLRDLLGRFVSAIARGAATTDVRRGGLTPRGARDPAAGRRDAARRAYRSAMSCSFRTWCGVSWRTEAQVLLAITNDAWYGRTGAPYQFLVMTAVRSAENRVWTARAANTGVSAIIDDRGRVRSQTRIFEQTLLVADVPLAAAARSFYARHGDWFAGACCVAGVAALASGAPRAAEPTQHERDSAARRPVLPAELAERLRALRARLGELRGRL